MCAQAEPLAGRNMDVYLRSASFRSPHKPHRMTPQEPSPLAVSPSLAELHAATLRRIEATAVPVPVTADCGGTAAEPSGSGFGPLSPPAPTPCPRQGAQQGGAGRGAGRRRRRRRRDSSAARCGGDVWRHVMQWLPLADCAACARTCWALAVAARDRLRDHVAALRRRVEMGGGLADAAARGSALRSQAARVAAAVRRLGDGAVQRALGRAARRAHPTPGWESIAGAAAALLCTPAGGKSIGLSRGLPWALARRCLADPSFPARAAALTVASARVWWRRRLLEAAAAVPGGDTDAEGLSVLHHWLTELHEHAALFDKLRGTDTEAACTLERVPGWLAAD
eukprot:TRINITY_DN29632_c0_g1_i1.p2 TRINITY_DN29632_c0_g1~~TRINITY_DN29632_c0_g1_i1.p2  ORF type:complete len:339 (+),score=60.47 TRINITY_DN29632_c0_g1_i1:96-1112(+)